MNRAFEDYKNRLRERHGGKFSDSGLSPKFAEHFGHRVEVRFSFGEVKRGWVTGTTGWRPSLMLLRRRHERGSSWLLDNGDEFVRVLDTRGRT